MGNFLMSRDALSNIDGAPIHTFYSSDAWIEGHAEDQLKHVAALPGALQVAGFPDLHPGKYGPVGCAILAKHLYPTLAGSDIGCGMSLFELDIVPRRIKLDKIEKRLRQLGKPDRVDRAGLLEADGLPVDLWPTALGTIGGGNHFCELQLCRDPIDGILDTSRAYLMVHSGSRGLGNAIVMPYLERNADCLMGADVNVYLAAHDQAVHWAWLNRLVIAQRAAEALKADIRLVTDNVHNLIVKTADGFLHRKGAAVAGGLVPLAGTRATESYLIDTSAKPVGALSSCAHGAGRKFDRRSMRGRISAKKSSIEALRRNGFGGRVVCEDKALLIEEAPTAYKSSRAVLTDLEKSGIARRLATLEPLVTFKNISKRVGR